MKELKDSRLGRIPESWKVLQLDQVCVPKQGMRRGPFGGAIKKAFFVEKGYQVYEQRNAIYDDFETVRYFIDEDKFNELNAFQLEANDFIVSCSGTIGKIAKVPQNFKKGVINQALLRLRLNREIIDDNYFLQQFRSKPFQNKITNSTQGGAMSNLVGMSDFRKTLITLPPFPEQQKIAEVLSTVDAKIEVIDQQIAETQELKKGLMQRLLTKGIGHTKFKDSPLGEIPESWEVVSLAEICDEIFLGLTSKVDYVEKGGFPFIRATDINTGALKFDNVKYISETQHRKLTKNRITKKGDVLVSKSGTLGTCAIVDVDIEFSTYESIITIQPKNKILLNEFLLQILQDNDVQKRMIGARVGGIVGHLNLMTFRKLTIPLPSYDEQKQISKSLTIVDEKLVLLSEKKTNYQELKKGLMQQLLTGKVRVKVTTEA